jgi:hypothetical protein
MGDHLLCGIPRSRRQHHEPVIAALRPNKRLKLAGGDRLKGSGVLSAGAHELSLNYLALAGESPAA